MTRVAKLVLKRSVRKMLNVSAAFKRSTTRNVSGIAAEIEGDATEADEDVAELQIRIGVAVIEAGAGVGAGPGTEKEAGLGHAKLPSLSSQKT